MKQQRRLSLVQKPTKLHPLPQLSRLLGGPEIWIKRDDNTGLALGGNKARKLEYLLHDAQANGATDVITVGGTQSNHARMTAAAAAGLGMKCHLVLRGKKREVQGNLLLDYMFGAQVHFLDSSENREEAMNSLATSLRKAGRKPYCIGVGGSNALGSLGYVDAVDELVSQLESSDFFGATYVAVGSGGTFAGLWIGQALHHWDTDLKGIAVDSDDFSPIIQAIANESERSYSTPLPTLPLDISYDFIGEGYSIPTDEGLEAIRLFAENEGILLDPVYTGKAAAGLIGAIRSGELDGRDRVLFWHTGGAPALFASPSLFTNPNA